MKRRLAWCALAAACCLLVLRPHAEPPPAEPPPPPPASGGVRRLEAFSAAAAHSAALLPPCPHRLQQPPPEAAASGEGQGRLTLLRAYEDLRLVMLPTVRLLAALDGPEKTPPLFCHLWSQGRLVAASRATPQEIWWPLWDADRNGSFVRPFLLTCPYADASTRPDWASLGPEGPCTPSTAQVPVQPYPRRLAGPAPGSVAVCVKGLDFPPDERLAPRLLEWVEANRLLGATRIRLYWRRPPTQPAVRRALRHLRRGGDVDVLESLHGLGRRTDERQLDLWQRRRLDVLDLTDCLYRSVGRHQFVLSLDIDEVLVPVADSSWQRLLSKLSADVERYASLSVQNYFFFARQNESFLDVTWRSANLTQDTVKSFVPTANALTLFNHYALHSLVPGVLPRLLLDTSVAQVNHYRQGCSVFLGNECKDNYQRFGQRDTLLIDKIGKKLKERVRSTIKLLNASELITLNEI